MASLPLESIKAALAGRYAVERELGQGGMAVVLLARDERHGRLVALKLLRPELAAVLGTERFLREIEVAAALAHPNILPLLDSGRLLLPGGAEIPYYVMPLVEGESLRDRLARGPLEPGEAVRLTAEIADALDCAHRTGVVHRDIKPDNILLQHGHAVVSDFGIARAVSAATGVARLTETGMSLGTRGYMSPEQFAGLQVDHRSDIYSLGCVVTEMLTGAPPAPGGAPLPRRLSSPIRAAVARALAPLPANRWTTAGEFATAMRAPTRFRTRTMVLASLVTTILLGLVYTLHGLGLGLRQSPSGRRAGVDSLIRQAGTLTSDRSVPHLQEAVGILRRVIQSDSGDARAWAVLARAYASADRWGYPVQGVAPDSLGPLALQYSERALRIDSTNSRVWLARGWVDEFLDPASKQVALRSYRRALALDSANPEAWSRLGFLLLEREEFESGLTAFRRAFALDPARYHYLLPIYFLWTRELDSATSWADSVVAIAPDAYWVQTHVGQIALARHDLDAAERHFSAAQRIATGAEIGGLCGLAAVAASRGEKARAREFILLAAARTDSVRPPVHNVLDLAGALSVLGARDEALGWLQRFEPAADMHFQLHLRRDPFLDGLRHEPRFQRLLRPTPH